MSEPKYTKAEQRANRAEFERLVTAARKTWAKGGAVVILSFPEYLTLQGKQAKRRRACSGSA